MLIRHRAERAPDIASAFRDSVRRLGGPDRDRTKALHVRVNLARACRVGLRDRLGHHAEAPRPATA